MTLYHSDEQMCRMCGGLCCQGHAGVWVDPRRFERIFFAGEPIDLQQLPQGTILRSLGGIEVAAPATLEQGCTFLGPSGCTLPARQRPCQCLALQPQLATLLEGEMHCTLPPACGSQTARHNWSRYWNTFVNQEAPEGN